MATHRSPSSQIYLMADPKADPEVSPKVGGGLAPDDLARALDAGAVACVLLRAAGASEAELRAAAEALRPVAHARDVAFLVEDRIALARETGCDGVHLSSGGGTVGAARQALGAEAIVGIQCGASRHAAMLAAEAGADYVAFDGGAGERWWQAAAEPELIAWWQEIMTTPCVAIAGDDPRTAERLAAAGADFVAVGAAVWAHPAGPDAAVRALLSRLAHPAGAGPSEEP
jgi:thiamine-phosphate pyrophosphorylase